MNLPESEVIVMKFKKVGRHALKCVVSPEEMWENGMQVDDFLQDRDKTEDFIRDVVERAKKEIGFECTGDAFTVQISLMADSSVVLMISNEDMSVMGFLNQLKDQLQGMQQEGGDAVKRVPGKAKEEGAKQEKPAPPKLASDSTAVISFATMDEAIESAKRLYGQFRMHSELYKIGETYHLVVEVGGETTVNDDMQPYVMDYYQFGTNDEVVIAHIREFGKVIIDGNAVEVLATLDA